MAPKVTASTIKFAMSSSLRADAPLREQHRGEPLATFDRGLIGGTPCVEKLHKLLARAIIIPFAVAFDDRQQMFERIEPPVFAVERERKIEARLMIGRIGGD